ncbi:ATP-binding protein [Nocardioides perillae]|uniref:histidine kinase n=1 Tax=Nocardioides perillae TaxID=1119534 RepID=A0A7Y9RUG7_9ACTN|nr:ATP-binding protein [Nocardioides perillae]NYG55546.1 hypothetical protein [Nocardioides perillae]
MRRERLAPAGAVALALVAVVLTGASAVHWAPAGSAVATWWPAAGIAVALVAVVPRAWVLPAVLGVVVAAGAANAIAGRELLLASLFGLCNGAEALIAGSLLRRGRGGRARLETLDDLFRLLGACLAGVSVTALGVAAAVAAVGPGDPVAAWRSVLAAHSAALLVLVPVALTWRHRWPPRDRAGELLLQSSALVVVTALVFAPDQHHGLAYAPLPLLVWAGLRLGTRVTSLQLAVLAAGSTWATAQGAGPFVAHEGHPDLTPALTGTLVQTFLLCTAVTALPLALTVAQRGRLLEQVRASETLFRSNFTGAVVGMVLLREDERGLTVHEANDAAVQMLGAPGPAGVVGRALPDLLRDTGRLAEALPRLARGDLASWSAESDTTSPGGGRVRLHLAPILDDDDGLCFAAQLRDVTEEHRSRQRLRAERELLRATLAATGALIVVTDTEGTVVRVNAATVRATGVPEEELLGHPVWTHLTLPGTDAWLREVAGGGDGTAVPAAAGPGAGAGAGTSAGASAGAETVLRTAEGRTLHVAWSTDVVRDADDRPTHVVLTGADVTAERAAAGLMSRVMDSDLGTVLLALDHDGVVTQANRGAARLLGVPAEELAGRAFTDLLDAGELATWARGRGGTPGFETVAEWAAAAGCGATREWTWRLGDGPAATVSTALSVVRDTTTQEVGWFCVGRDVTASRRSHELLVAALEKERHASDRLRELDAAKNDFVSTVSHELRTPVTSIVGYAEMLSDGGAGELDALQASMLAAIERNGQRLIALADDLLTLSRLESGTQAVDLVPLDLRDTVRSAETALRPLLSGRWLDLALDVPDQPVPVRGDVAQLDRVLLNLLSNAVKFTEDGGSVGCALQVVDAEARLVVSDTGIGVPLAEQASLFSKFYRATAAQERAIQGTGLGLSIVASILESHGGRVEVDSVVDEGTRFTVSLPLHAGSGDRLGREPETVA